ncbi:TDT family transporter [Solimicrobium silvestre]|uniref:Tellurite resistance protein and related permease n=1 Tax=Solimicrobium silvestre TaxID=2099400 RepID=A0A2S9H0B9_9BURK|nr:TDT family transporter [Solimicrobium silvestre]PRC93417.1 Tellurite resistance protein and related permease [Solimicrobium silvestre]
MKPPLSKLGHRRELIRQFTPNWFTMTMGTGIVALALGRTSELLPILWNLGATLWVINIALFLLFVSMYCARWIFFFDGAKRIFHHSVMCMFFGAIPMGLATIINGFLVFGIPLIGERAISIAFSLWWLDAAMALICGLLIPFFMFTRHDHSLQSMTAVWLLPIVAAEVTAASGGLLISHMNAGSSATQILFISYSLWGFSVLPALAVLVILFLRMVLHKLPGRDMAASSWLSIGPIGTGALGLLLLGTQAQRILISPDLISVGIVAHGFGILGATILLGYGFWWLVIAILTTLRYLRDGLPFNMGWWAFTFPIGVYSLATLSLADSTGIQWLYYFGYAFVSMLIFFWYVVMGSTLRGAYHGNVFFSPCISDGTGLQLPSKSEKQKVNL